MDDVIGTWVWMSYGLNFCYGTPFYMLLWKRIVFKKCTSSAFPLHLRYLQSAHYLVTIQLGFQVHIIPISFTEESRAVWGGESLGDWQGCGRALVPLWIIVLTLLTVTHVEQLVCLRALLFYEKLRSRLTFLKLVFTSLWINKGWQLRHLIVSTKDFWRIGF